MTRVRAGTLRSRAEGYAIPAGAIAAVAVAIAVDVDGEGREIRATYINGVPTEKIARVARNGIRRREVSDLASR